MTWRPRNLLLGAPSVEFEIISLFGTKWQHVIVDSGIRANGFIEFPILHRCLFDELSLIVDNDIIQSWQQLLDRDSPQGRATRKLNSYVAEGSICGSPVFSQRSAMLVMAYYGWYSSHNEHCDWFDVVKSFMPTCVQGMLGSVRASS